MRNCHLIRLSKRDQVSPSPGYDIIRTRNFTYTGWKVETPEASLRLPLMAGVKLGSAVTAYGHGSLQLLQESQYARIRQQRELLKLVNPSGTKPGKVVAEQDKEESSGTRLGNLIRTKQRILQSQLGAMAAGQLEERLASVRPAASENQLLERIAAGTFKGRTTIFAEVARLSPAETPESLAERCRKYMDWGADVLAVCTDEEKTPDGLADLKAVCKAVQVPVLRKDWIIHPLQIAETREAGADGLTAVCSVLSKGTLAILNYAVSLGLDTVVETVNLKELQDMAAVNVPLYGFNISVALALSLPGVRGSIAKSLIGEIPFGAVSVVGVRSKEEAIQMKLAGADAVYLGVELFQGARGSDYQEKSTQDFLVDLKYAMTGDD